AGSCIKDDSCIEDCPVDCIHPHPGNPDFQTAEHPYIDPGETNPCRPPSRLPKTSRRLHHLAVDRAIPVLTAREDITRPLRLGSYGGSSEIPDAAGADPERGLAAKNIGVLAIRVHLMMLEEDPLFE